MSALAINTGRASALPLSLIAQAIPMLTRHDLEALTERLIDHLDQIDGDTDVEDGDEDRCEAGDDGCGPMFKRGIRYWGSDWEEQGE